MPKFSVSQLLRKAESLKRKGDFVEAQKIYSLILEKYPKNKTAKDSIDFITKKLKPLNEGNILKSDDQQVLINFYNEKKFDLVIDRGRVLLKQFPKSDFLWNILGASYKAIGLFENAINAYKELIEINPSNSDAYNNLGIVFKDLNRYPEAEEIYKKAIQIDPTNSKVYNNLGNLYRQSNKYSSAKEMLKKAIAIDGNFFEAYNNLGLIYLDARKIDKSIEFFKKTLEINPNYAFAWNNLGLGCKQKNDFIQAENFFIKSININPSYVEPYNNLGNLYRDQKKFKLAIETFKKASKLNSNLSHPRLMLYGLLRETCQWDFIDKNISFFDELGIHSSPVEPFYLLGIEDNADKQLIRSKNYSNLISFGIKQETITYSKKNKINVGYFSADFHNHATMDLLSGFFQSYDKNKFEIHIFSYGPDRDDDVRKQLISNIDFFYDIRNMSDDDVCSLSREKSIDIAIDLKGYTRDARLKFFAKRVAPVQISFLGYPGSSGSKFIDYIIADEVVIPKDKQEAYSEKIIYMPNCYQPNDLSRQVGITKTTRAFHGLPDQGFIFCCFNNNYKISREVFSIWLNLLNTIENSYLWLLESNEESKLQLMEQVNSWQLDKSRIIFAKKMNKLSHLERYRHADLFLDTFNVNAHTTCSEALLQGLPVITLQGMQFASRVASSILSAMNLDELIANNEEEYESIAFNLASDESARKNIKKKILENISSGPLFNIKEYTSKFEVGLIETLKNKIQNKHDNIYIKEIL